MKEKMMKYLNTVVLLLAVLVSSVWGLNRATVRQANVFNIGEELIYKVKWSFIRVGTLRLVNEGLQEIDGKEYFKLKIYIDSAKNIPFVTIHDVYESYVDSNAVPRLFYAYEGKGDHTIKTTYDFRFDQKSVHVIVENIYSDRIEPVTDNWVPVEEVHRDVLALLFFARLKAGEPEEYVSIPTFVLEGQDHCYFDEMGVLKEIKHDGTKIPAYYLKGKVKFIGIAGVKDDFEGWFSTDAQRVPIKAKMKAFFGSVTIQLEEHKNWLAEK